MVQRWFVVENRITSCCNFRTPRNTLIFRRKSVATIEYRRRV